MKIFGVRNDEVRWNYDLGIIGTSIGSLLAIEEESSSASLEIIVIILQACCICKVETVA